MNLSGRAEKLKKSKGGRKITWRLSGVFVSFRGLIGSSNVKRVGIEGEREGVETLYASPFSYTEALTIRYIFRQLLFFPSETRFLICRARLNPIIYFLCWH